MIIEKLVTVRLRSFIQSENEVMDELTDPEDRRDLERLLRAAKELSDSLASIIPKDFHWVVRNVVHRVTIHRTPRRKEWGGMPVSLPSNSF
jgi:hypothetical protein